MSMIASGSVFPNSGYRFGLLFFFFVCLSSLICCAWLTSLIKPIQFIAKYWWYIFKFQFSLLRLTRLCLLQTEWTSQWGNFESRTEIQQTPPTILPEEVRIDRQNPKFLGNNICQPPTRYIFNTPLFFPPVNSVFPCLQREPLAS